ncbi:DUF5337 domain-containing protein [Aquicoccus sp. G2-2]|uniref:DUF5337 domain-containing protein n=1 Tax=Aquicoccus sp. G2-2 TaxID=3092120 RepID=UPI002ADF4F63|nr:DUF5337 domain-containing protein [Aquicoccus sp. G2-2]MEA1113296.1 DUF5337 domain-containing protein [Aquicoccus sp. G2-2]
MSTQSREKLARKGRIAALVIAGTAAFWVIGLFIGEKIGLSQRALALIDLIALGGFIFSIALVWQIWRARQKFEG